ncbi:hypothetical protein FQA39_LY18090 [Lamprigera yunnana]|nr:hypothetical protein FQA39_LY18090 [Lamprigera yunnana]
MLLLFSGARPRCQVLKKRTTEVLLQQSEVVKQFSTAEEHNFLLHDATPQFLDGKESTSLPNLSLSKSHEEATEFVASSSTALTGSRLKSNVFPRSTVSIPNIGPAFNDEPMNVQEVQAATGRYTRRYFCIYCKELFAKLAQHLEHQHKDVPTVQAYLKLRPGEHTFI